MPVKINGESNIAKLPVLNELSLKLNALYTISLADGELVLKKYFSKVSPVIPVFDVYGLVLLYTVQYTTVQAK